MASKHLIAIRVSKVVGVGLVFFFSSFFCGLGNTPVFSCGSHSGRRWWLFALSEAGARRGDDNEKQIRQAEQTKNKFYLHLDNTCSWQRKRMGKQKKESNKKEIQRERESGGKATWKTALKIGFSRKTKGCQTAQKFVAKDESQKTRNVRQREKEIERVGIRRKKRDSVC